MSSSQPPPSYPVQTILGCLQPGLQADDSLSSYPITTRPENPTPNSRRRKRGVYIPKACDTCRRRKIKCGGEHPCAPCARKKLDCLYQGRRPLRPDKVIEDIHLRVKMLSLEMEQLKEINRKIDRMTFRGNSGDSSDPGAHAALEQRTADEQPPENPESPTPVSGPPTQAPHSAPLLNTSGSSLNAFDPICATSPSKERHYLIPVIQRIKVRGVDTMLGFRISIPGTCLSTMTDKQRKCISYNSNPMSRILYCLTDYIYGSGQTYFNDTQIEVQSILEDGIRPFAGSILPTISHSGPKKRLVELRDRGRRNSRTGSVWQLDSGMMASDIELYLMQEAAKQQAGSDLIECLWRGFHLFVAWYYIT
ncbi:hypothetical protein K469DRAFT_695271 [Zopfia rhizophila CBS 207.26]|uniref:Zn(2)-C6 fungal-type domain-containing protein n=1 Tax=Zopfia rhizophila CBS 207.26 TaxID=1314779 RepID=A0A6A6DJW5_9PEZI|nr:hypothetical protein K469DRAFT_695271 [Zopfia rhizophila CBS 207.26]